MRRLLGTLYFCRICKRAFVGSGDKLPCGHSRYTYDSGVGLRDKVLVNAKALRVLREFGPGEAPQCQAVASKAKALQDAVSVPN